MKANFQFVFHRTSWRRNFVIGPKFVGGGNGGGELSSFKFTSTPSGFYGGNKGGDIKNFIANFSYFKLCFFVDIFL